MRVSAFTIVRNAIKYNYPAVESIRSILPLCDEFVVNVGESEDKTLELIQQIKDDKVKIIKTKWDFDSGEDVLSKQTNIALNECSGDWAFYLQSDEVIHEKDHAYLRKVMAENLERDDVDVFCLNWLHFFGSYFRYRIDKGWFQKQNRIIRNNGKIESCNDAFAFRRKDGLDLNRKRIGTLLYHYGWVQTPSVMTQRRINAENIGYIELTEEQRKKDYCYGDLSVFPLYFGSHPAVMEKLVDEHPLTKQEMDIFSKKFWWYPPQIFKMRYKTCRRIKERIEWY